MVNRTSLPLHQAFHCPIEGRTTSIEAQLDPVSGAFVILWQRIQLSFQDVQYCRHGEKEVHREVDPKTLTELDPPRIKYHPGVILEVVQDSRPTLRGGPRPVFNAPPRVGWLRSPPKPEMLSSRPRSAAFLEETNFGRSLLRMSQDVSPKGQASIGTYCDLLESYLSALMTGQGRQMVSIKTHMTSIITSLEQEISRHHSEAEEKYSELARNQKLMLENDREAKATRERLMAMQRSMHEMQEEILTRLAAIHCRVQAVLVQTYELFEYPIPRLFIVLPVEPDLWDKLNPFTHRFRLYFLCECGDHSKPATSSNKPHHIHLAKHHGYDLLRPTEFFERYGSHLLTMLDMVKYGITTAGIIVPTLATLGILDGVKEVKDVFKFGKEAFGSLLDEAIEYVKNRVGFVDPSEGVSAEGNHEVLEGATLRQLSSFLTHADEDKTLGNLYRIVTDQGHVKWVCLDHYREGYLLSLTRRCAEVVALNGGEFNKQLGKIKIALKTPRTAQQFYDSLCETRGVTELVICLAWDATKVDLETFCTALLQSNISILTLVGDSFDNPLRDAFNRNSRFNPVMQLVSSGKIQSLVIKRCGQFLERVSRSGKWCSSSLRILKLESDVIGGEMEYPTAQANLLNLSTWFPNLVELFISCFDIDKTFATLREPLKNLRWLSTLTLSKTLGSEYVLFKVNDGDIIASELAILNVPCTSLVLSGTIESLRVKHPRKILDWKQLFMINKSLSRVLLLGDPSLLWDVVKNFDSFAIGREQPLSLKFSSPKHAEASDDLALIEYRDPGRTYKNPSEGFPIQGWKAMMFIQHWSARNIKMVVDDYSTAVLQTIAGRFLKSKKDTHLDLDISGLTTRSLGSLQKALQVIKPNTITLVSSQSKERSPARHICERVDPNVWRNLWTLRLLNCNEDRWVESLSQLPASTWKLLDGLSLTGTEMQMPVSSTSVHWISLMVSLASSQKLGVALRWLELKNIMLHSETWMRVIDTIDFSTLWRLELPGCNLTYAHIVRLSERIGKSQSLRHLNLRGMDPTTLGRVGLKKLRLEKLQVDFDSASLLLSSGSPR
ncbi:hypothetical protein EC968_005546 [Mortierella alpina]|nr:hypothetical protein EC968_005546 [Mortierella alpina]